MSHHIDCVWNNVINSQELYTMQNYTSGQTQMTKLWHFSNLTAYFSGDLGKKTTMQNKTERSKATKRITAALFAYGYSDFLILHHMAK